MADNQQLSRVCKALSKSGGQVQAVSRAMLEYVSELLNEAEAAQARVNEYTEARHSLSQQLQATSRTRKAITERLSEESDTVARLRAKLAGLTADVESWRAECEIQDDIGIGLARDEEV